jgi:hypothetical protein
MKKFERVKLKPKRSFPEKEKFASRVRFELDHLTRSSTLSSCCAAIDEIGNRIPRLERKMAWAHPLM